MMPAKAASPAPSAKDDGEQPRHADADNARHVGIVDAGADHGAEPGAVEQQPERDRDHQGDDDDGEPIMRKRPAVRARRKPPSAAGRRDIDRIAAPDHQAEIGGHERDAERDQHLRQLLAGQLAQQKALEHRAEGRDQQCRHQRRQPEIERHAEQAADEGRAEIGAEHEQRAVRQVRDAHQPEDQREARRQQEQQTAKSDAVDRQQQPKIHSRRFPALASGWQAGAHEGARRFRRGLRFHAAGNRANRPAAGGTSSRRRSRTG